MTTYARCCANCKHMEDIVNGSLVCQHPVVTNTRDTLVLTRALTDCHSVRMDPIYGLCGSDAALWEEAE